MKQPDFQDSKNVTSGMIEAYFKELIRKTFGNKVEDAADVMSSHGTYHVYFSVDGAGYAFDFKRKSGAKVAAAIRALK
jgi:hypothetical protein